jgi:polyisoprenoid-binding protein YceI
MKKAAIVVAVVLVTLSSFVKGGKEKNFKVDTKNSTVVWTGKKVTGEHKGNVPLSSGTVVLTDNKVITGTFEFNLAAITNTDITDKSSNEKLLGHLKSEDFFSTAKFPTAKFVITKATSKAGENYEVTGNLTIKGITNPIAFPAAIKISDKKLVASGKITVDRTKFDIKFGSKSFFESIGDKAIYDDFILDVNLTADSQ